jgi:hypothetical protein
MTALDYQIRVEGLVPAEVLEEIEGVQVAIQPVGTILRGTVVDQAALHEVINHLQGLGLELVEVRRLTHGSVPRPAAPARGHE